MTRRKKIVLFSVASVLVLAFLVFFSFPLLIFFDAFVMYPIRAWRTRVAIPQKLDNSGVMTFYRNQNGQWQSDGYDWNATYQPPGGGPSEKLDSWTSNADSMQAYASGPIVLIVESSRFVVIRTSSGKWTYLYLDFPGPNEQFRDANSFANSMHMDVEDLNRIQKELEPSVRTSSPGAWILHYAPKSREFVIGYGTAGGGGRVLLQLSEDGEKIKVMKIAKGKFKVDSPPDSTTPDPEPKAPSTKQPHSTR